ncbi:MAG: 2-amino-4-hydroxy-6-hydroxymethyldihydropteridine diphosphokinase [Candidatus Omnitrophica bacterium]|nr:2-amino-4-hydroxy-6-hydroxymethyldihydropteridine diphosphokinase [Candidatus Omnitrophota bacterium]
MVTSYIGLGSNLGDREKNINSAIERLKHLKDTRVSGVSSIIETKPVGGPPQEKFLNAVVKIQTKLSPKQLLRELQDIELQLGRIRSVKNGPRTIDLDILFYGNKRIKEKDLIIPHPRIKERDFVLIPLGEIAPQIVKRLSNEDNKKDKYSKAVNKKSKAG